MTPIQHFFRIRVNTENTKDHGDPRRFVMRKHDALTGHAIGLYRSAQAPFVISLEEVNHPYQ